MPEAPPAAPAAVGPRQALSANLDLAFAVVAVIAFVAAQIVHPTAKCGPGIHPSLLFDIFAWTSGIGFLLASFLTLRSRKRLASQIPLFVVGLVVTLVATIALLAASSPFGLGLVDSDSESPTMQSQLRLLASPPAAGEHAYWLGASFRGATIQTLNGEHGWSTLGHAEVYYSHIDEAGVQDISVVVATYRAGATEESEDGSYTSLIVRTKSGQDVRITFQQAHKPDAKMIAEARAAVQAIPRNVGHSGCA